MDRPPASPRQPDSLPALQIDGLHVGFGGLRVIDDFSMRVEDGQIVSLIGPNGAGKTTVLNCISGFVRPQRGIILSRGRDLTPLPAHARAGLGIARTFQNLQLFEAMTVLENLLTAMHTRIRTNLLGDLLWFPAQREEHLAVERAYDVLARLGLRQCADQRAGDLSFGQQKLLGVARCLAGGARLLLLDEPAAGLNRQEALALGEVIRALPDAQGAAPAAVLLVEHNVDLVMRISDRVVVLNQGRNLAEGVPDEVRRSPAVIAAYLGTEPADG